MIPLIKIESKIRITIIPATVYAISNGFTINMIQMQVYENQINGYLLVEFLLYKNPNIIELKATAAAQ